MSQRVKKSLEKIYQRLFDQFGPQRWWPAKTRFEVIVGAILTQNTNWGNVEKAIGNLRAHRLLTPRRLKDIPAEKLAQHIRPAGYFNVKAKRLKNFIDYFYKEYAGDISRMAGQKTELLREQLLSVSGIGPETADSILLYALDKPIFVVDAYTKRIFSRHALIRSGDDYHAVQKKFMNHLKPDVKMFNEYHALVVRLGKNFCRTTPRCAACPLNNISRSAYVRSILKKS